MGPGLPNIHPGLNEMSNHTRNWLKLSVLVGLSFTLGLFFAGLLDLPRTSLAQQEGGGGPAIVQVDAPRIPAAKPLAELSAAYSAVAEAVRPSVVFIQSERADQPVAAQVPPNFEFPRGRRALPGTPRGEEDPIERSSGSGFVVSADGYILTNHHVIEGASRVRVLLLDGRSFDADIVGSDKNTDVGVLKIDATGLTPAALGSSDAARVGEWVLAIGNPLGAGLTFSVTQGIISAKGRGALDGADRNDRAIADFIQTDAAINRGNSGGPLVNVRGEVIGINSAIASYTGFFAGYAFAVPIDLARNVMNQVIRNGRVVRSALGITVKDADADDAAYLGLDSIGGVRISNFAGDDSPAKRAGLQRGDVILSVEGRPVRYVAQLQQAIAFRDPGSTVNVGVARVGGVKEFAVRIVAIPDEAAPDVPVRREPRPVPAATNRLGITVEPLSAVTIRQYGLPNNSKGLLVRSIQAGSPAEDRLIPADRSPIADVITEVEGKTVRTEEELKAALKDARNGVVTLTVTNPDGGGVSRIERVRVMNK